MSMKNLTEQSKSVKILKIGKNKIEQITFNFF